MQVFKSRSYCIYCNTCYGGEGRLRDVTYLFLKILMVKIDVASRRCLQVRVQDVKPGLTVYVLYPDDDV
jgi:hypothetical protein